MNRMKKWGYGGDMDPEVLRAEILEEITEAFSHRKVPLNYTNGSIPEDENDEFNNLNGISDHIREKLIGKHWWEIEKDDIDVWFMFYFSLESICYFLPKILTETLSTGESYTWVELSARYSSELSKKEVEELKANLTVNERLVIARYIHYFINYIDKSPYSSEDYEFWRY